MFTLDFHLPYYVLTLGKTLRQDFRKKSDGTSLRQSWELPFPSTSMFASKPTESLYCLYEAQVGNGKPHSIYALKTIRRALLVGPCLEVASQKSF
jgi:hypothetical protein